MRAERANVFDVGVVQKVVPGLDVGVDAYYKRAKNLIDDGQFGAAYVLTAFNYEKGENIGVELSAKYTNGGFQAYANLAWARQIAINPVSNQFLFDNSTPLDTLGGLTEYQYLPTHYVYTDHAQSWTGSAGASYLFCGRRGAPQTPFGPGTLGHVVRHAADRQHDLWQRVAQRRCQSRNRAGLHAVQYRHLA